jgi:hypothetical protein
MMTNNFSVLHELSDGELLARVHDAVRSERIATAGVIALLMELDARRLYLGEGCSSLFSYCTQVLHLSEHAAYNRIETARAARRFPIILELVESAAVTLTTVRLLAPHLTDVNHRHALNSASHKSKREVEVLVAALSPRPDVPSTVRKLPAPTTPHMPPSLPQETAKPQFAPPITTPSTLPAPPPVEAKPLTPVRYKIQITVSRETYEQLRRAQDLLRHAVPNGDPAIILGRALALLVEDLERKRTGKAAHPRTAGAVRKDSRHIPAAVRRTVWQRDNGCCAFSGPRGRCTETGFLEYHHVVPFAEGGETTPGNLELRCRAHNQYEAELWFGVPETSVAREERSIYGP